MKEPKILIVQPDAAIARGQRKQLEGTGHKVVCVASSREALESVPRGDFALMVLEYQLPGEIDGLETYAHLRADGYELPVILVTDSTEELVLLKALKTGVSDFLRRTPGYLGFLGASVDRLVRQIRHPVHRIANQSRLSGIIESAKDAIITVNQDQRITLFNPAAEHMFCCAAKDAIAQPITRFLPREFSSSSLGKDLSAPTASLSTSIPFQTRGIRSTGEEFPLEATLSRFEIDQRKFYTLMVRDITERVRAEHALQRAYEELERRVQERTNALSRAQADMEARVKECTTQLQQVFEEERTRLAKVVEEELGTSLAGLKEQLQAQNGSATWEKIAEITAAIDAMALSVRRVTAELDPKGHAD